MKGIILAGGKGTRLLPATRVTNKHMIPILNRPMILYPLETLKKLGIIDIMIVSGGNHIGSIAEFLGDGSEYGVSLTYRVQKEAGGIAQALALAEEFAQKQKIMVILGDNIFENEYLTKKDVCIEDSAGLYLKEVENPSRFGVPVFKGDTILKIEEKPAKPQSKFAVTGLYCYPTDVFQVIKTLKPSARGELEITDVNNYYISKGRCDTHTLKGFWSDAGTPESLAEVVSWVLTHKKS